MKTKVTVGECIIYVEGTQMRCPLCSVLVLSGETHLCRRKENLIHSETTKKKVTNGKR